MSTFGRGILFACFRSQIATESERCFFWIALLVALSVTKNMRARMHILIKKQDYLPKISLSRVRN